MAKRHANIVFSKKLQTLENYLALKIAHYL